MNYLDITLLCIVGLLVFNGVRKGFIISLATLVALVLGIWASIHFSGFVSNLLIKNFHPSGTWLPVLSFSLTFLIVVVLVILLAKGLEKLVSLAGMGLMNHLAGGLFGLLKGIVLASVLIFIVTRFDARQKLITAEAKNKSMFYGYVQKVFPEMVRIFGGDNFVNLHEPTIIHS